ncbi:MAG: peptidoglycan DD-metalloendopeptidase family protein [Bacteroidales bacterium]|jgi:hypothetical protein|nr:peptidoglycan DD-metalloendopeptidase family protein [Bacteroidales bacterium]
MFRVTGFGFWVCLRRANGSGFGFAFGELTVRVSSFLKGSLCLFLLFSVNNARAQQIDTVFRQPLDIPVLLSATFAELRANHLHSGIDFRTQGTTGHKIYACEQGYVSRISVSSAGYGNALYITHPNGYTTVYGHLDAFNDDITAYVKQQQYEQERFAVNLYPDTTRLPVKRGDVVGFSGNTGSSGGPHLHFEVRDTKTEETINPLHFGLGVRDNIAPIMRRMAVYPIGEGSTVNGSTDRLILDLEKSGKTYRIAGMKKLKVVGKVAFGIDTYDQTYGSVNRCGPYSIRLWVDSFMMFSQTMDRFSFDESRYINSLVDYDYYIHHQVRFNRMYIEPNNRLSVYDRQLDRGITSFPDSGIHKALVVVRDFHGNNSRLNFTFEYAPGAPGTPVSPQIPEMFMLPGTHESMYKRKFTHVQPGLRVTIPADALYNEIDFTCVASRRPKGLYSDAYKIHNPGTPLHKAMTIEIAADSLPERLREKALVVQIEPSGRRSSAGGTYRDGVVCTDSRVFGEFAIGVDTVPPRITPVNIKNGANMRGVPNIRFKIGDNFSGINTYSGWIDGQWALFQYDAKNDLLYYCFDTDRLTKNTQHALELKVTDSKGNTAEYRAKFTW